MRHLENETLLMYFRRQTGTQVGTQWWCRWKRCCRQDTSGFLFPQSLGLSPVFAGLPQERWEEARTSGQCAWASGHQPQGGARAPQDFTHLTHGYKKVQVVLSLLLPLPPPAWHVHTCKNILSSLERWPLGISQATVRKKGIFSSSSGK